MKGASTWTGAGWCHLLPSLALSTSSVVAVASGGQAVFARRAKVQMVCFCPWFCSYCWVCDLLYCQRVTIRPPFSGCLPICSVSVALLSVVEDLSVPEALWQLLMTNSWEKALQPAVMLCLGIPLFSCASHCLHASCDRMYLPQPPFPKPPEYLCLISSHMFGISWHFFLVQVSCFQDRSQLKIVQQHNCVSILFLPW